MSSGARAIAIASARREQDREHVTALIQANQAWIWRYLRYRGCDPALADDLTQETFVAVLSRSEEIDPKAMRSYLRRVASSLFSKVRKRARRQIELVDATVAEVAFDLFCAADDGSAYLTSLRSCLASLDERGRQVIEWRYGENMPPDEIGQRLKLSAGGVKSLFRRTHARLRECVTRRMEQ